MPALSFCSPVRNISQRIFEHVLPCRMTMRSSLREVSPTHVNFSAESRDSNISLFWSIILSFASHSRCVHPIFSWSRNDHLRDPQVSSISSTLEPYAASFQLFLMSSTNTDKNNPGFPMNKQTFQIRYFFPSKSQQNFFELSFPQEATKRVSVQISLSWKTYPYI